jgi:hypothetical protein
VPSYTHVPDRPLDIGNYRRDGGRRGKERSCFCLHISTEEPEDHLWKLVVGQCGRIFLQKVDQQEYRLEESELCRTELAMILKQLLVTVTREVTDSLQQVALCHGRRTGKIFHVRLVGCGRRHVNMY